jgi:poly(A) polymerase
LNASSASVVTPTSTPRVITRSEHIISRQHISPNALRVLYRLRDAGFMAFLVGGCVRDLLIGIEPKDFDVATDALPEQVRKLFRNCRLVGRRFRLAHVFFGREIIEVATFRAATAPSPGEEPLAEGDGAAGEESLGEAEAAAAEAALRDIDAAPGELAGTDLEPGEDALGEDADSEAGEDTDAEAGDEALSSADVEQGDDALGGADADLGDDTLRIRAAPAAGDDSFDDDDATAEVEAFAEADSQISGTVRAGEAARRDAGDQLANDVDDEDDELGDDAGNPHPVAVPRRTRRYEQRSAMANGDESAADLDVDPNAERMFDETGRILRDNVYGTIDADVWRRDLTANALYYNIADFSIWDYVGGFEDIAARKLKLIGDPETRFREDPVRMLRAARFEAKLGFEIDPTTSEPIGRLKALMGGVPPARLFDETLKLFLTGHGRKSFEVLRKRGLLSALLPTVDDYFNRHPGSLVERLVMKGLENTDARVLADRPVTPTFLFALLLYGPIAAIIEATPPERWHELSTILDACDRAARQVQTHITLPKRFSLGMREMFALQPRLEHPRGRRALRVLEHPRFRAAYDLLLLRAEFGMASSEITEWWTKVQEVSAEERARMADTLTGQALRSDSAPRRGGRRRRRRRGPSNSG